MLMRKWKKFCISLALVGIALFALCIIGTAAKFGTDQSAAMAWKIKDSDDESDEQGHNLNDLHVTGIPFYCQRDPLWNKLSYAEDNIGYSGCGLVAGSMAFSYLTGKDLSPPVLLSLVGNSCVVGGGTSITQLCNYAETNWGIQHGSVFGSLEEARSCVEEGKLVFMCVSGNIRDEYHTDGHYMLMYDWDVGRALYFIKDPNSYNEEPFTYSQIKGMTVKYYIAVWKEEMLVANKNKGSH